MTTPRPHSTCSTRARMSNWFQVSWEPLSKKGDEADKLIGRKLLEKLLRSNTAASIVRTYQQQQQFVADFLTAETRSKEEKKPLLLREYRIPALKSMAELHRRVSLLNFITEVEEKIGNYSTTLRAAKSKAEKFSAQEEEAKKILAEFEKEITTSEIKISQEDMNKGFTIEEKESSERLRKAQEAAKLALTESIDVASLNAAITNYETVLTSEIALLSLYFEKKAEQTVIFDRFKIICATQLANFKNHENDLKNEIELKTKDKNLIPILDDITRTDLACAFHLYTSDPFPNTEFKIEINNQKSTFVTTVLEGSYVAPVLNYVWNPNLEKEWDELNNFADTIYVEFDQLRNNENFLERLKHIENAAREYNAIKQAYGSHIQKVQHLAELLNEIYLTFCAHVNTQIRGFFDNFPRKQKWQTLIKHCTSELNDLKQLDHREIVTENRKMRGLSKDKNAYYEAILALLKEIANEHNTLNFWSKQTTFGSEASLYGRPVPKGIKALYDELATANASPDKLRQLITNINDHVSDSGCLTFFARTKRTARVYSSLAHLTLIVNNLYHFHNPVEISQNLNRIVTGLRSIGLTIDEKTVFGEVPSTIAVSSEAGKQEFKR